MGYQTKFAIFLSLVMTKHIIIIVINFLLSQESIGNNLSNTITLVEGLLGNNLFLSPQNNNKDLRILYLFHTSLVARRNTLKDRAV